MGEGRGARMRVAIERYEVGDISVRRGGGFV